jgi:hypothetical protein
MTNTQSLPADLKMELVRGAWYSHDARWFNAVAEEFGFDTANKINQRAVLALGAVEARRLARALGVESCPDLPALFEFLEAGCSVYVPSSMIEMSFSPIDDASYELAIKRCFVADNIQRAGIADSYECAIFHRVHAWHEALGLPLADEPRGLRCAMAAGKPCRRTLTIAGREGGPDIEGRSAPVPAE